jgi:hypothetical protein
VRELLGLMEYEQGERLALQTFDWVSPFGVVFL